MKWENTVLENLYFEPSRNGIYKPKEFHGSGYKIVNMGELFAYDFINNQEMERIQLTTNELEKNQLANGDLLFGRRSLVEEGAGKCSLVTNLIEPTTFESSIIRVRLDQSRANPRFYYYWFCSRIGRGSVLSIVSGTNVKGIRGSELKKLTVPTPPLSGQNTIASILSAYDDLIENNLKRIKLLEEFAQLLYKEWFVNLRFPGWEHTKIVDGVPEGWEIKTLEETCYLVMGQSPESEFYNDKCDGLPFHQGVTEFGDRFISHRKYCTKQTRIAESGDILCSVRAPVGRLNITKDRIIIGRGLSAIRNKANFQSFQFYQLKNHFFQEDMIGGGAIFASVTKKELSTQKLLVPSKGVLQEFEDVVVPIDRQIEVLTAQNQKLKEARDLLLPRLMDGTIEV